MLLESTVTRCSNKIHQPDYLPSPRLRQYKMKYIIVTIIIKRYLNILTNTKDYVRKFYSKTKVKFWY